MGKFTDKGIQALQPKANAYREWERGSDPGFCVRVTPAGTKTFQLAYTWNGKRRYLRLGTYPNTSLADARDRARDARGMLEAGQEPAETIAAQQREQAAEEQAYGTLRELFEHYYRELEGQGRQTREVRRALEGDVLNELDPKDQGIQARDVTPDQIKRVLHNVHSRGARSMAAHLRRYLHRAFQLGIHHDNDYRNMASETLFGIPHNPVADVPADTGANRAGNRELSWDEIRQVWHDPDQRFPLPSLIAFRLLLITGQRVLEVIQARASEFDLDGQLWTIPAERIKTRQSRPEPHVLPITDLMAEQIEAAMQIHGHRSEWLFPAYSRHNADKPMGRMTLAHAASNWCRATGMEPWTPRDLRRTWKTRAGEAGIPKEARDRVQNHSLQDVGSVHYDRYDYLTEKRKALEDWCKCLDRTLVK